MAIQIERNAKEKFEFYPETSFVPVN